MKNLVTALSSTISVTLLLLPSITCVAQQNVLISSEKDIIEGESSGYLLLPPRSIADHVLNFSWSPTGKYLLYHQIRKFTAETSNSFIDDEKRNELFHRAVVVNLATGKELASGFYKGRDPNEDWYQWADKQDYAYRFGARNPVDGDSAAVFLEWLLPAQLLFKAQGFDPKMDFGTIVAANPVQPKVAFIATPKVMPTADSSTNPVVRPAPPEWQLIIADAGGVLRKFVSLRGFNQFGWNKAGDRFGTISSRYDNVSKTRSVVYYALNETTGAFEKVASPLFQLEEPDRESRKFNLSGAGPSQFNSLAPMPSTTAIYLAGGRNETWSQKDFHPGIVAASAEFAQISPSNTHVAFISNGVLQVREIVPVDLDAIRKVRAAAEKAKAMSNAKQAGTGLMIYAADYDDVLPSSSSDWKKSLEPYLKNRSILDSFTYTYQGGSFSNMDNPWDQEIGYVEGPGGRAIVYADSHVVWRPNTPELILEQRGIATKVNRQKAAATSLR